MMHFPASNTIYLGSKGAVVVGIPSAVVKTALNGPRCVISTLRPINDNINGLLRNSLTGIRIIIRGVSEDSVSLMQFFSSTLGLYIPFFINKV